MALCRYACRQSAEWRSPLLDAGARGVVKTWVGVGAEFASPAARGDAAITDGVTLGLEYSLDAGATWTAAASATATGGATRTASLSAALTGKTGRGLQVRVTWASGRDWAPTLVGAWADYATEPEATFAARRRWRLEVACRDERVAPDGAKVARTGRQLAAALWTAYESGAALGFKDVDYDAVPVTRTVRIEAMSEAIARPADAGRWGDSVVSLTLVEA